MKTEDVIAYCNKVTEQINSERLEGLNFDDLRDFLCFYRDSYIAAEQIQVELLALREDYIARIGGMVKAIAAVSRGKEAMKEGVMLIESLEKMTASELILMYKKIRARFRDHFPYSLRLPETFTKQDRKTTEQYT